MGVGEALPRVKFGRNGLHIEFAGLFGPGAESQSRRFARRAFTFPEIHSLHLEPDMGKASLHYQLESGRQADFLVRLAAGIGGTAEGLDESLLPLWMRGQPVTLHRFGRYVSVFEITQAGPGRLQLRHAGLARNPALGRRLEDTVRNLVGIKQATVSGNAGKLWVCYEPELANLLQLIRAAEAQLFSPRTALATLCPAPARMGLANATLGLAALGEFAWPALLPVCIAMLVFSSLGTLCDAARQLRQGKVGLPTVYAALLCCSISTQQIVAYALMKWSFRFWAQRIHAILAGECRTLLEENLPIPAYSRIIRSNEVDALVSTATLQPGNHVLVDGPGAVPADGRVVAGSALVEENTLCGSRSPVRKSFGDKVFAGSQVLAGNIEVEVWHTGTQTRAARIARSVIDGVRDLTRNQALPRKAEAIAERTVLPTLAVAGLGWAVGAGGLFTVGAVLHADYASGPKIAVPLETLRAMNLALRSGAVVRTGDALHRLAESRFLVLDDHPAWACMELELERMDHSLAESETDNLLCHVVGAGLYLGDGRTKALVDSCLGKGLAVHQPPLIALDAEKVTVRQGVHTIVLRDGSCEEGGTLKSLVVEIDGEKVATLEFRHGKTPRAAAAVECLRQRGMQVFLLSSRPTQETERLASQLGTDLRGGDFSPIEKLRFMRGLQRRGVCATYIGNGQMHPELAREAHVSVSLGGGGLSGGMAEADIVLLGDTLDAFADVAGLALGCNGRIRVACRQSLLPNLLCAAGGYADVLNSLGAALLTNLGVNNVYRQAALSLRNSQSKAQVRGLGCH